MRYTKGVAVSAFLFSLFAGVAVAAPRAFPTNPTIHFARQAADVPAPPVAVPSTGTAVEDPTSLADNGEIDVDAANTTSTDAGGDTGATDSTDALGGLLSGLTDTVGSIVSGLTDAVGNVADGVTDSSALGDLLSGITDSSAIGDLLSGVTDSSALGDLLSGVTDSSALGDLLGSVTDTIDGVVGGVTGAAGLKRNDRRAFFRRRLDARHFESR